MRNLGRNRATGEQGFTLIELMVVVMIIAILIAIAVPTFLGARSRAQARSTQHDVRVAHTLMREMINANLSTTPAAMAIAEPAYTWQTTPAAAPGVISYSGGPHATYGTGLHMAAMSENGKCYIIVYLEKNSGWTHPLQYLTSDPPCGSAWGTWGANPQFSYTNWQ